MQASLLRDLERVVLGSDTLSFDVLLDHLIGDVTAAGHEVATGPKVRYLLMVTAYRKPPEGSA